MKLLDFRGLKLLYVLSSNCIGLLKCMRLADDQTRYVQDGNIP